MSDQIEHAMEALGRQINEQQAELTQLRTRNEQLEADCGAMRQALQFYASREHLRSDRGHVVPIEWGERAQAALQSDAGKALLEEGR